MADCPRGLTISRSKNCFSTGFPADMILGGIFLRTLCCGRSNGAFQENESEPYLMREGKWLKR